MRLRPFILCFYRTAFTVQKSGLKSSAFRSKLFPQISPKSYRHNAVPNRFSSRFSTSFTNGPCSLSQVKAGTHSPLLKGSHTTAYTPKQGPSLPRPHAWLSAAIEIALNAAFAILDSATLLYTYISRFFVNPHYQRREKIRQSCSHKIYPPTVSHGVSHGVFQLLSQTLHVRFHT